MSVFRQTASKVDRDTRQVVADVISQHFGYDDDALLELDLEDNPQAALSALEVETAVDDEFIDDEVEDLFIDDALGYGDEDELEDFYDLLYEDDEEDDDEDVPSSRPADSRRRASVSRVREAYGARGRGFLGGLARLVGTAGESFLESDGASAVVDSFAPGAAELIDAGISTDALAEQAGKALGRHASQELAAVAPMITDMPVEEMPPTYVADDETPAESVSELEEVDLDMEESFGATCVGGFVSRAPGPKSRKAVVNSLWRASKGIETAPYGAARTFVEDPSSQPVLLEDGRILDEVYGQMCPVPCPSCARMSRATSFGAVARDCAVCDGFGALLIPEAEVPSFVSTEQYGWVPFLLPLVAGGVDLATKAAAANKASMESAVKSRKDEVLQRLLELKAAKDSGESDEDLEETVESAVDEEMGFFDFDDLDADDDEEYVVLRALTPKGAK